MYVHVTAPLLHISFLTPAMQSQCHFTTCSMPPPLMPRLDSCPDPYDSGVETIRHSIEQNCLEIVVENRLVLDHAHCVCNSWPLRLVCEGHLAKNSTLR